MKSKTFNIILMLIIIIIIFSLGFFIGKLNKTVQEENIEIETTTNLNNNYKATTSLIFSKESNDTSIKQEINEEYVEDIIKIISNNQINENYTKEFNSEMPTLETSFNQNIIVITMSCNDMDKDNCLNSLNFINKTIISITDNYNVSVIDAPSIITK